MDVTKMIAELRSQRDQLDEAIIALERMIRGTGKRRGRPPKWLSAASAEEPVKKERKKKRVVSPEARKRMAEAQRRRWEAARKAEEEASA
jgi:hypothetical protein